MEVHTPQFISKVAMSKSRPTPDATLCRIQREETGAETQTISHGFSVILTLEILKIVFV